MKVDEIEVLVTGTLFNVEAYPETKEVKMTLVEGRVEVKTEEHRQLLSPDEQALVDKQEGQIRVRKVVAEEYIGWTNINKILSKIEKTGRVHFRIQGQCIIVE